jgi:hypothetical protein
MASNENARMSSLARAMKANPSNSASTVMP